VYRTPVLLVGSRQDNADEDDIFSTQQLSSGEVQKRLGEIWNQVMVAQVMKRSEDAFQAFIWIGREARCDIALPFEGVSKLHGQFIKKPNGGYELLDAGSTNGTFVNNTRLERNKPINLEDQTRIRFGGLETRFRTAVGFWEELGRFVT
jgi:hypothetical protein